MFQNAGAVGRSSVAGHCAPPRLLTATPCTKTVSMPPRTEDRVIMEPPLRRVDTGMLVEH